MCCCMHSALLCAQLDSLSLGVETAVACKKRMLDLQRRVGAMKARVDGWRSTQLNRLAAKNAVMPIEAQPNTPIAEPPPM